MMNNQGKSRVSEDVNKKGMLISKIEHKVGVLIVSVNRT